MIKEKYPDADIVLFSGIDLIKEAKRLGADYMDKGNYSAKSFAAKIKERIDSKS